MFSDAPTLAPLQWIMLRDSLASPGEGMHVEQLEIVFKAAPSPAKIAAAWAKTVARCDVLRAAFSIEWNEPIGWCEADETAQLEVLGDVGDWESWLAKDRVRPLLRSGRVPWRVAFRESERRWVWTFHHALLDGRSITRIVRSFLGSLESGLMPEPLHLTSWQALTPELVSLAKARLLAEFAGFQLPGAMLESEEKAGCCLGRATAEALENFAESIGVTPASILTWAWGQAVAEVSGGQAAAIEQVRCGPPQAGAAGFSINTLPLLIHRAGPGPVAAQLRDFRRKLLEMREMEALAPEDLPLEVCKAVNGPWSSVLMTEHAIFSHEVGFESLVETILLHENPGESLTATAFHHPDLRLEVEGGPNRQLLRAWVATLEAILPK